MPTIPRTGLTMGWTGVTATDGTTPVVIGEVTDVDWQRGGSPKRFYGDARKYPAIILNREQTREVTIIGGDAQKLALLNDNTVYVVTAILNDARNGTGIGSLTLTLNNAVLIKNGAKGQTNEFTKADATFSAFSTDGTDPLTIVEALV